ncbi:MAG: hypothetical protein OEY75_09940 [Hylemonella sp.]|nr:hypothetical protein [Hylemonella sp.]
MNKSYVASPRFVGLLCVAGLWSGAVLAQGQQEASPPVTEATTAAPDNDAQDAPQEPAVEGGGFLAVFYGRYAGVSGQARAKIKSNCLFFCSSPSTVQESRPVALEPSAAMGVRVGYWFTGSEQRLGYGLEFQSGVEYKSNGVQISYDPIGVLGIVRFPVSGSNALREQGMDVYLGAIALLPMNARIQIAWPELPAEISGKAKGSGFELLGGVQWRLGKAWLLFAEIRRSQVKVEYAPSSSWSLFGDGRDAEVDFTANGLMAGLEGVQNFV